MGSVIPFIFWIFCVGLAALIIGKTLGDDISPLISDNKKEGFLNMEGIIEITTCPPGTKSYIIDTGDTYCCEGDVIGKQCNGRDICSLSPNPYKSGIDSCRSWLVKEWITRSRRFCPKSMINYFGKMNRTPHFQEGCSASLPTSDGAQPSDIGQPKCIIYSNYNDDISKQDSCTNIKEMDNLVCPTSNATKSVMSIGGRDQTGKTFPLILKCNYLPPNGKSNGLPVDCMDDASVRRYLSVVPQPVSEEYLMNSVRFCGASKAYYIDGTLSSPEVLDVPGLVAPVAKIPVDYDDGKVYAVGDLVVFKGIIYKMVESAGAAGYRPDRPGDRLWAKHKMACVKGIGKPNKDNTFTEYTPDECKSIGGTFFGQKCFNSPEAPLDYRDEHRELFISAMKSGTYIVDPKNDAERESNKQFEILRDKTLGKKYTRNYDCHT